MGTKFIMILKRKITMVRNSGRVIIHPDMLKQLDVKSGDEIVIGLTKNEIVIRKGK